MVVLSNNFKYNKKTLHAKQVKKRKGDNVMKKKIAMLLAATLLVGTLVGCGSSDDSTSTGGSSSSSSGGSTSTGGDDTRVIKILWNGEKNPGWDEVYAEFLERTKDTLNIELDITFVDMEYKNKLNLEITSGADYDLVFEATWLNLRTLSAEGFYADLSEYFNNPDYPGLMQSFPEEVMESNRYAGIMCYIPVYQAFGNGAGCVYYRQDWADEWGIGKIDSYEKLEEYWAAAKADGIIPYACSSSRGYYQLLTIGGGAFEGSAAAGIQVHTQNSMSIYYYVKDGELITMAAEGAGDEAFADFPDGWNYDFTNERYEKNYEWASLGYNDEDSVNATDYTPLFDAGNAASYTGTVETMATELNRFHSITPEGELGFFVYSDSMRNMEAGAIPTNYAYNNGYAIPASSKNIDATMEFFDWLHSSEENFMLFSLGIEGVHWEAVGDNQFTALEDYPLTNKQYLLTLSPIYARFSDTMPEEAIAYAEFSMTEEATIGLPVRGFVFDASDLTNETSALATVTSSYASQNLGILTNGTTNYDTVEEMRIARYEQSMDAGLGAIMEALKEQLEAHLANQ